MKTAKILETARGTSPSHCTLRYVELEELIGEFGGRTRLGKLAAALRTRLEEEDWDCSDLRVARAEYEHRLYGADSELPHSEFMAGLARKVTSERPHARRDRRARSPRYRTTTSQ
jgi:hypothetical protein